MQSRIEFDDGPLKALLKASPELAHELALSLGFEVEARAKVLAAVDTGFMRNAVYVNAQGHEGHGVAESAAQAMDEKASMFPSPAVPPKGTVEVVAGAEYSIYVETGTATAGAQPFLAPALAETAANADAHGKALIERHTKG